MTPPHLAWIRGRDLVIGSLFSGYGGLEQGVTLALLALGARSVRVAWVADVDPGAARILAHRYPDVPNLGDITRVDWHAVERVDIVVGGFPCQDVSHAGKRAGLRPDTRSGLWTHMAYIVSILRPRIVVAENVRGLLSAPAASDVEPCPWCLGDDGRESALRALGAVLGDLADLRYDAQWIGLRASDVGAPHGRFRVFVAGQPADADCTGREGAGDPSTAERPGAVDPGAVAARRGATPADADRVGVDRAGIHGSGERRRPEPADGGRAPADAGGERHGRGQDTGAVGRVDSEDESRARQRERTRGEPRDRGAADAPTDTDDPGRGRIGRITAGIRDPHGRDSADEDGHPAEPAAWGPYGPAVNRWATALGRPAPAPTQPSPRLAAWRTAIAARRSGQHPMPIGRRGPIPPRPSPVLSPRFVEWMMGLPAGWVTDVPNLTRSEQLKALGNGVVPLQAAAAVRALLQVEP